jgi:hypothetical protein
MRERSYHIPKPELYIDLRDIAEAVEQAFKAELGENVVRRVRVNKYPSAYGVMVYLTQQDVEQIVPLGFRLEEEFRENGVNVWIATELLDDHRTAAAFQVG